MKLALCLVAVLSTTTASLINYLNPGPRYSSADEDAAWTQRIAAMLLGAYDQNHVDHLKELVRQAKDTSESMVQRERRRVQAEMATSILQALPSVPLKADKQKAVMDILAKTGYGPHVRSVLRSHHTSSLKDDKKLAETMSKRTSASFALSYCTSEYDLLRVLFTAEQASLQQLTDADLQKAAGRSDDAFALRILSTRLTIQSKHTMQEMLRIRDVPCFYRTPHDGVNGTPMEAGVHVWNHVKDEFVGEPLREAKGVLKRKAADLVQFVGEKGAEVAQFVDDHTCKRHPVYGPHPPTAAERAAIAAAAA